jgi:HEAT repeat protein
LSLIGRVPGKRARNILRRAATRHAPAEALIAARALLKNGDHYGYRTIERLLRRANKETRLQAISLLVEYRNEPAAQKLLRSCRQHVDSDVSRIAADALDSTKSSP